MQDREIEEDWVERTLDAPLLRAPDPAHDGLERFYQPISDRDGRVLRVVVRHQLRPLACNHGIL